MVDGGARAAREPPDHYKEPCTTLRFDDVQTVFCQRDQCLADATEKLQYL
jgi:hypothetical protein